MLLARRWFQLASTSAFALCLVLLAAVFLETETSPRRMLGTVTDAKLAVSDVATLTSARRSSNTRIVASMSTFPARMDQIRPALSSLFNQSIALDAVHVNIPDRIRRLDAPIDEDALAKLLAELQALFGPRLHFHRGEDYGPATKLIGALPFEQDPDTLIVTVDDDVEYDYRTVQALFQGHLDHPSNFIAAACEELTLYANNWVYIEDNRPCRGWACAFKGILYRVGMFDSSIFDYSSVPKGCVVHDDVYLSGYLLKRGYRPFHIGLEFDTMVRHHWRPKFTVGSTEGVKDHQIECIKYFDYFKDPA
ncbi:hypothetical protein BC831DRAFT_469346 [Entophlyctis helioformis]|nr:hypothetical protein BC831DRAFT_469346 [Entophlyctis helioformis]